MVALHRWFVIVEMSLMICLYSESEHFKNSTALFVLYKKESVMIRCWNVLFVQQNISCKRKILCQNINIIVVTFYNVKPYLTHLSDKKLLAIKWQKYKDFDSILLTMMCMFLSWISRDTKRFYYSHTDILSSKNNYF